MTSAEFKSKYQLLKPIAEGAVRSFVAQRAADKRVIMVHFLDDASTPEQQLRVGALDRLPPAERSKVIEVLPVDDDRVVVTQFLFGFQSFDEWVGASAQRAGDPTLPMGPGAGRGYETEPRPRRSSPPVVGPTGESATTLPGRLTVPGPPPAPIASAGGNEPEPRAPKAPGEFTRLFGALRPDAAPSGSPAPGPVPAAAAAPPASPAAAAPAAPSSPPVVRSAPAPGSFTQLFGAPRADSNTGSTPPPKVTPPAPPAVSPPVAPVPPVPPAPAPVQPMPPAAPQPAPAAPVSPTPPAPPAPAASAPGEFTRMFQARPQNDPPPAGAGFGPLGGRAEPPRQAGPAPHNLEGGSATQLLRARLATPVQPASAVPPFRSAIAGHSGDAGATGSGRPAQPAGSRPGLAPQNTLPPDVPPVLGFPGVVPDAGGAAPPPPPPASEFTRMMARVQPPPAASAAGVAGGVAGAASVAGAAGSLPGRAADAAKQSLLPLVVALGSIFLVAVAFVLYFVLHHGR